VAEQKTEAVRSGSSVPHWLGRDSNWMAIADSLEDELLVIDRNYRILAANAVVLKRHGLTSDQVIGRQCFEVSHGLPEQCHPPRAECPINTLWETGKAARVTHAHIYQMDGKVRRRYLDIIVSPIRNPAGEVVAATELMRDVTDTKLMEMKIAALSTITSAVSRSLDLDTVLENALTKTLEMTQNKVGAILLVDEDKKTLDYACHRGLTKKYLRSAGAELMQGLASRANKTGKPVVVADVAAEPGLEHPELLIRAGLRSFVSVPLHSRKKVIGVLNVAAPAPDAFEPDTVEVLVGLAAQIAIAVDNARLHREVQRKDKMRGDLVREMLTIQEEERRRIARELHDETSQSLASLAANLKAISEMLPQGNTAIMDKLELAQRISINTLDEIHRIIYELRPTLVDDLGLVSAARWLADNNLRHSGIRVNFSTRGESQRLPSAQETGLFRVIEEIIGNIGRHAGAHHVRINLSFKQRSVAVRISDDGHGFDVEEAIASKDRPRGLGLIGMRERVDLMRGTLEIVSSPGKGTRVHVEIPFRKAG
jgi:PAS domain S-box-containing protein